MSEHNLPITAEETFLCPDKGGEHSLDELDALDGRCPECGAPVLLYRDSLSDSQEPSPVPGVSP